MSPSYINIYGIVMVFHDWCVLMLNLFEVNDGTLELHVSVKTIPDLVS